LNRVTNFSKGRTSYKSKKKRTSINKKGQKHEEGRYGNGKKRAKDKPMEMDNMAKDKPLEEL